MTVNAFSYFVCCIYIYNAKKLFKRVTGSKKGKINRPLVCENCNLYVSRRITRM